jgi:uncharacterized protein GlcG (DUF336 family)
MNALKDTSLVTQMQLASILKAHTAVDVKTDTKALGKITAQVQSFL